MHNYYSEQFMKNGCLKIKKIFDFPAETRMIAVTNDGNVSVTASI